VVIAFCVAAWNPVEAIGVDRAPPKGTLIAFDAKTGDRVWRAATAGVFSFKDVSPSTLVGRGFPCTGAPFRTVAFDARNGNVRWRGPAASDAVPSIGGDLESSGSGRTSIVVVQQDREIQGRDARGGKLRWRIPVPRYSAVSVTAGAVFVASGLGEDGPGNVRAFDRKTGKASWTADTGAVGPTFAHPSQSAVAVTTSDPGGTVVTQVLDPATGEQRWRSPLEVASIDDSVVALRMSQRNRPSRIVIHDTETGRLLWQAEGGDAQTVDRRVQIFDGHTLSIHDARSGRELWKREVSTTLRPVMGEKVAVVPTQTTVMAFDVRTGRHRWTEPLPEVGEGVNDVAVGADAVYVTRGCAPNGE
jgi:outer membrane protein assembly factor BamB